MLVISNLLEYVAIFNVSLGIEIHVSIEVSVKICITIFVFPSPR